MESKYGNSIKSMDKVQLERAYGKGEESDGTTPIIKLTTKPVSMASLWSISITAAVSGVVSLWSYVKKC